LIFDRAENVNVILLEALAARAGMIIVVPSGSRLVVHEIPG